ncbi:MAG: ribosomal protein L13e [Candidatus Bathyarchaeota archaeon]|nr:ribosomal protein L13e [Candidatus Bathyarchaeota archaeon]
MEVWPIVYRKNRTRKAKGFSRGELKEADIDTKSAVKLGLPVDPRRRSRHEENIGVLRRYLEDLKEPEQPEDQNIEE